MLSKVYKLKGKLKYQYKMQQHKERRFALMFSFYNYKQLLKGAAQT